jgi:predicted amidohydrolase
VLRAAAVQLNATPDKARNLATADRLVRAAVARGAALVVLPEKWMLLGDVAQELSIDLVAGSVSERVPGADRLSNTCLHIGPDGEPRASYRKVHMFDVEVDGTVYRESEHEAPGDEPVVSRAADGTVLGLSICYDLRFPELYRVLALRGARVLCVPAAFTLATTRDHWEPLLRARAIEDGCFVIAANQIGEHAPGLRSGGRSMIIDPWGIVLASAPDSETVICADLDLESQDAIRERLPALANRRPTAYRWPEGG